MKDDPNCPVCGHTNWEVIGKKTYSKRQSEFSSDYTRMRINVLFGIWLPNEDKAEFNSILCHRCGFVAFTPRPSALDVDRKYQYLFNQLSVKEEVSSTRLSDQRRSADLYHYLLKHRVKPTADILDYAGGNGRLMSTFVTAGHTCSVVDYAKETIPNIRRLGNSLDDVPASMTFDVIICSHVLEHLAEPAETIKQLVSHLRNDGVFYVEVPLDIWDGVPLPEEPVTHINFFSPRSLGILLERAGLNVINCEEGLYTTEEGQSDFAIRAVAQRSTGTSSGSVAFGDSARETKRLIFPSFNDRLLRLIKYHETRDRIVKGFAKRYLPRAILWRL